MTTRKLMLSCNLMLTAEIESDGDVTHVSIEDARHATIGYATGEVMTEQYKSVVSRKTLVLGLQALIDKLNKDASGEQEEPPPALMQKGADA